MELLFEKLDALEYTMEEIRESAQHIDDLQSDFLLMSADYEAILAAFKDIRKVRLYIDYYGRVISVD